MQVQLLKCRGNLLGVKLPPLFLPEPTLRRNNAAAVFMEDILGRSMVFYTVYVGGS